MAATRDVFNVIGTVIAGKYRVDRVLGEGGFGLVYAGVHTLLGAPIAIKCIKPSTETAHEDDARTTDLFLREARMLFTLTHPGIVRLYDVGTLDSGSRQIPYVVLELLDGPSLEREIEVRVAEKRPFSAQEIFELFEPVLEALSFAHGSGVAHRDMKPSNIMLAMGPGGVRTSKVVDFGIARWFGEKAKQTAHRTGFTPAYAAPEQWDETLGSAGPASDVFSVALAIAEACTLRSVFELTSPAKIFAAVMDPTRRIEIRTERPDLPAGLDFVLQRATRIDMRARYADCGALLSDFRAAYLGTSPPSEATAATLPASPAQLPSRDGAIESQRTTGPASRDLAIRGQARGSSGARDSRSILVAAVAVGVAFVATGLTAALMLRNASQAKTQEPPALASAHVTPMPSVSATSARNPVAATATLTLLMASAENRAAISTMAESHLNVARACYTEALGRDSALSGEVTLMVSVLPTGKVFQIDDLDVEVDRGSANSRLLHDSAARLCLVTDAKTWVLPTHKKEDVNGAIFTWRFLPDAVERAAPPPPRASDFAGDYTSIFTLEASNVTYPPTPARFEQKGARVSVDYPDGTMGCNVDADVVHCTWVQEDHNGRAMLRRQADGKLVGTWGYAPSDSDGGKWTLAPQKPKTAR